MFCDFEILENNNKILSFNYDNDNDDNVFFTQDINRKLYRLYCNEDNFQKYYNSLFKGINSKDLKKKKLTVYENIFKNLFRIHDINYLTLITDSLLKNNLFKNLEKYDNKELVYKITDKQNYDKEEKIKTSIAEVLIRFTLESELIKDIKNNTENYYPQYFQNTFNPVKIKEQADYFYKKCLKIVSNKIKKKISNNHNQTKANNSKLKI